MAKDTFYITTSLPYVNAAPHVGHAAEMLQADVLACWHRLLGEEVFFLTGTDEHGKKVQEAAAAAGKTPQEFADQMSAKFAEAWGMLGVEYSDFIRTTDEKRHIPVVLDIWEKLSEKGDIYKGRYEGWYCVGCEAFLREAEMKDGNCVIHQKPAQRVSEENYFFRFSKYADEVRKFFSENKIQILPEYRKNEVLNLFSAEGVKDISFSRPSSSVEWGVKVPGDESQTMYVWVDALLNYLSGIGYGTDTFKKWWPADVQLIGKDIARFHTMIWPAMLLSLELGLPKSIYIHGFVSIEGRKMSKSTGNVINPTDLVEKYGNEAVRYFLLSEIPSSGDGDFSYQRFEERYTSDLQNGLGNLVSRVTAIGEKFDAIEIKNPLLSARENDFKNYKKEIDEFELNKALEIVCKIVDESNKLVDESRLWEIARTDAQKARATLAELAGNICAIGILLLPFLPQTAEKVLVAVGIGIEGVLDKKEFLIIFKKPEQPLFPRLGS